MAGSPVTWPKATARLAVLIMAVLTLTLTAGCGQSLPEPELDVSQLGACDLLTKQDLMKYGIVKAGPVDGDPDNCLHMSGPQEAAMSISIDRDKGYADWAEVTGTPQEGKEEIEVYGYPAVNYPGNQLIIIAVSESETVRITHYENQSLLTGIAATVIENLKGKP